MVTRRNRVSRLVIVAAAGASLLLAAASPGGASSSAATVPARATTGATGPGVPGHGGVVPEGVTTVPDGTAGKVAGMAIPNVDPQQSTAEVQRLHNIDGLNTIALFVWWWMPKVDSNVVERCSNPASQGDQHGCNPTEPDAALQVQIAAARQNGMRVILVPIFYCGTCEGGWRGTAQPSDVNAWFNSYRLFIDHYATLAQQNGVSTMFAGSEMDSLESQTAQWQQVISEARQHFSGQIGYEQNWDVLGSAHFLDAVDIVGVSAYFPLDDGQSPSLASLVGDWSNSHASAYKGRNWVANLASFARSTGKPILFGEVGYMSSDYAGRQPFLNYQSTINWQLQSDLYQALLETFEGQSWWAGAVWWEWYIPSNGNTDDTRTPRGKTAETLIQHWYHDGWRPASAGTPLVLSDAAHSPNDTELDAAAPAASPSGSAASGTPGSATGPSGAAGTRTGAAGHAATAAAGTRAGRPGASSGTARTGTQAAAGAGGVAGTAGAPASGASSSAVHGTGRTVGLIAAAALALLVLALLAYNAVRLADSRRHPPSTRLG
ncbi:MAG TPA: hypothetical protein VFW24_13900 [Acidimicrobiales bacterium]|nr:hypothetical protein [Acidimicrobiales bacterium]